MIGKYDPETGQIVTLASGVRMWIGTQSAHDTAVSNGTMPNNVMVCITDDYAAPETSGTGTRNIAYVSDNSFSAKWFKYDRVCTVEIQLNLSADTNSNEELITGFPKPITPVALVAQGNSNTNVGGLVMKANGAVRTHYLGETGQFFHVTATYITAE